LRVGAQLAGDRAQRIFALYDSEDWKSSTQEISTWLQEEMPVGAYAISLLPLHQTAFVKINDKLGYFFDPNCGIIEINGSVLGEKLYQLISNTVKDVDESEDSKCIRNIELVPFALR
jgi:hypothetical protein